MKTLTNNQIQAIYDEPCEIHAAMLLAGMIDDHCSALCIQSWLISSLDSEPDYDALDLYAGQVFMLAEQRLTNANAALVRWHMPEA